MRTIKIAQQYHLTWDAFLQAAKDRVRAAGCWNDSAVQTDEFYRKFTGVGSLPEAIDLASMGWPEGRAQMLASIEHDSTGDVPSLFPAREYDLAGEFPDVAAYCAGTPEHMVSLGETTQAGHPVFRVAVNGMYDCRTAKDSVIRFGVALLSHVSAYQRAGYSVAVDWIGCNTGSEGGVFTWVELLPAGGTLDLDRLAFMLAHPGMLRRLWFAFVEMQPELRHLGPGFGPVTDPKALEGLDYPGIMLPLLERTPTETIESAAQAIGECIEQARG
jgi:hypothetical protein